MVNDEYLAFSQGMQNTTDKLIRWRDYLNGNQIIDKY